MENRVREHLVELGEGILVERDVLGVVEAITEYDPNLFVQFCDPALADVGDAPYRIMEHCRDGVARVVFYAWRLDGTVLKRIYMADTQRINVIQQMEKQNEAAKKEMMRRYQDKQEIMRDITAHIVANKNTEYTFPRPSDGAIVQVSENKPPEVVKGGSS